MKSDPPRAVVPLTLVDALAALLVDPGDRILARSIFGTDNAAEIADRIARFVERELGTAVAGCPLATQSVGAVFGLDLARGDRVAVKVHAFGPRLRGFADLAELTAVYAAQDALAAGGVACAPVVRPPFALGDNLAAAIMGWLDAPPADDPHAPATRRALATELARIGELAQRLPMCDRLPRVTLPTSVFFAPHNALFDFTTPGGEWIDQRAAEARSILDEPWPLRVMHTDFSCANVRVVDGAVAAIYDVDSLAWTDELRGVASAAVHFTYTGDRWTWPSRDDARAFVADYEAARGMAFTATERRRLAAAAIYALAYTARCEHALGGATPMADVLRGATASYL